MNRMRGFSLVEVSLIAGIICLLLAISSLNLSNIVPHKNLDSVVHSLISDIKFQQTKAMTGEVSSSGNPDSYGVHFNGNSYTLFVGSTFSAGAPDNFNINPDNISITSLFAGSTLVFQKDGAVKDFNPAANTITVSVPDTDLSKVITLDKYGAVK